MWSEAFSSVICSSEIEDLRVRTSRYGPALMPGWQRRAEQGFQNEAVLLGGCSRAKAGAGLGAAHPIPVARGSAPIARCIGAPLIAAPSRLTALGERR